MTADMENYLAPGEFINSDDPAVAAFSKKWGGHASTPRETAVSLYYAVRDQIRYNPYYVGRQRPYYRARDCLRSGQGFCVPKAALLAAVARCAGIPARVGYADVRNHLTTPRLAELVGSDIYVWHGYTDLFLDGQWVKATPAFNLSLCERFGVHALDFDGCEDSLFQEFDTSGRKHMEYVRYRDTYADVPYQTIVTAFEQYHPRWLHNRDAAEA